MRSNQRCAIGVATLLMACASCTLSGCAAVKATQQPAKRDMGVLEPGVPRSHVIAELGSPVHSERRGGDMVDVFSFKQGYSKSNKAARALVHGAADVMTLGLWEVVGLPAEALANGTDVQLEVTYDDQQNVNDVVVIKGEKAVHPPKPFGGDRYAHNREGGFVRARDPEAGQAEPNLAHKPRSSMRNSQHAHNAHPSSSRTAKSASVAE